MSKLWKVIKTFFLYFLAPFSFILFPFFTPGPYPISSAALLISIYFWGARGTGAPKNLLGEGAYMCPSPPPP